MGFVVADAVDRRGVGRVEKLSLFVEVYLQVVRRRLEIEVFDCCGCMLADFYRDLAEHHFLADVIERDLADPFADVGGKLFGSAALSRHPVEKAVDLLLFGATVGISEVVEEVGPMLLSVSLE